MGFQIPCTAVQVVLSESDVPSGTALMVFSQALGGALTISIAQNVLSSRLSEQLFRARVRGSKLLSRFVADKITRAVSIYSGSTSAWLVTKI